MLGAMTRLIAQGFSIDRERGGGAMLTVQGRALRDVDVG
jgi:hypothetical protein